LLFLVGLTLVATNVALTDQAQFLGLGFTANKAVTIFLLFLATIHFLGSGAGLPRNAKNFWVLAFAGSVALSMLHAVMAGIPSVSLLGALATYGAVIPYYFLLSYIVKDIRDLDALFIGLLIGGSLVAISSLLGMGGSVLEAREGLRSAGLGGNVNEMALNVVVVLAVALCVFANTKFKALKVLLAGIMFLLMLAILRSLSRAAWMALLAMGGVVSVRHLHPRNLKFVLPALLLAFILPLFLGETAVLKRVSTISEGEHSADGSVRLRFAQIQMGIQLFASSPIWGVGMLRSAFPESEGGAKRGSGHTVIHNMFLTVLAEQGLIGAIPFMLLLLLSWRDFERVRRISTDLSINKDPTIDRVGNWAVTFQMSLLGVAVSGLGHPFERAKILWLLIAAGTFLLAIARRRAAELSEVVEPLGAGGCRSQSTFLRSEFVTNPNV